MSKGFAQYSAIKRLLYKYNLEFRSRKEYQDFINELLEILNI